MSDMTFIFVCNAFFATGAISVIIPLFIVNRKGKS